jgi:hypothetical protein
MPSFPALLTRTGLAPAATWVMDVTDVMAAHAGRWTAGTRQSSDTLRSTATIRRLRSGTATRHPCPGGLSTRQRRLLHRRAADCVGFVSSGPRSGGSAARAAAVSSPGADGSSRLSSVCASVAMFGVAALGVVRLGGRRLPACKCSRGRRPTGCDSAATGPLAALLQRHPSGDGGRLTPTRLRPACRLQGHAHSLGVRACRA